MAAPKRKFIKLKGQVPGPKSRALMARREKAVPRGPFHATPIFIEKGSGARVTDVDGNTYLDFAGGLGCLNVGHTPDALVERIREQAGKYLHSCFHVMPNEPYVALAERLNELAPGKGPKKTILVNSGAEGVENAVKIAKAATGRAGVICFEDAFHGRTLLGMTLTSKVAPYKTGFGPFAPEVYRLPYPYNYRWNSKGRPEDSATTCADALEPFFKRYVDPKAVAAVIVEPILGEGGFVVPPVGFFAKLREICDAHGIVLIADEVQAGMGRTGAIFASERVGLVPDLVISAKSLAGGLPLAAVTGRADLMDAPVVGGLGGTYGGNPLAVVAALEVIKELSEGHLLSQARHIEETFFAWAERVRRSTHLIGDVRGLGGMVALELVTDTKKTPAKDETARIAKRCWENGLITITAGTYGNVMRMLMPLVITDEELDEGLDVLEAAILAEGHKAEELER